MRINIRDAICFDAPEIAALIQELAESIGEPSPITPAHVLSYLGFPGCNILLAEQRGQVAGLLNYSVRPSLYHNGDTALIEELVVRDTWRGQGVGGELLKELLRRLEATGCVEVSVTSMPAIMARSDFTASMDWWTRQSTLKSISLQTNLLICQT